MIDWKVAKRNQLAALGGVSRARVRDAVDDLMRADFYIGCAAASAEKAGCDQWRDEADALMQKCIELRQRITREAGL